MVSFSKGPDRISSLPDDLLSHILSFLPTHFAVRTGVLSKRWMYLWTCVETLHLDDRVWFFSMVPKPTFENMVDQMLYINSMPLRKFRLHCSRFHARINLWICCAVRRKVREMDLSFATHPPLELTQRIFTCETLVVLRMRTDFNLHIPNSATGFPSLKILHLSFVNPNTVLMKKLFRKCPVLEELQIDGITCHERKCFEIFVPTLKRLSIRITKLITSSPYFEYFDFYIMAPALEYIDISDDILSFYHMENLHSLIKAKVNVGGSIKYIKDDPSYAVRAMDLLSKVVNTKSLSLSATTMRVLHSAWWCDYGKNLLPTLPNLMHLELRLFYDIGWEHLVVDCLESSPKLKVFVLRVLKGPKVYWSEGSASDLWTREPFPTPDCLSLHLKVIEIGGLKGQEDELVVVKQLLKNAKVLDKMIIDAAKFDPKEALCKKLLMSPRGRITSLIKFL